MNARELSPWWPAFPSAGRWRATSCTSTSTSAKRRCRPGTRLAIGDAVIEITAKTHRGCAKFAARFGPEALRFVNTGPGRVLNLRGRNARVVTPGVIHRGDAVRRLERRAEADGSPTPA